MKIRILIIVNFLFIDIVSFSQSVLNSEYADFWNLSTSAWDSAEYIIYKIDNQCRVVQDSDVYYDSQTQAWINNTNITYWYSGNNLLPDSFLFQSWDLFNSVWVNSSFSYNTFTPTGKYSQKLGKSWDTSTNTWVPDQRSTYTYDINDNLADWLFEMADATGLFWHNYLNQIYSYNANSLLISRINQQWDSWQNTWYNVNRNFYTYNSFNKVDTLYLSPWNDVTLSWDNGNRNVYWYNANHHITSAEFKNYNSSTGMWENGYFKTFTTNGNGDVTDEITQQWSNSNNAFYNLWRYHFNYSFCTVGINEISALPELKIYPNPASSVVNLAINNISNEPYSLSVLNAQGQIVRQYQMIDSNMNYLSFSVSDLKPGIYLVFLQNGDQRFLQKLLIAK